MVSRLFGAFRSVLSGFWAGSSAWGPGSPPPAAAASCSAGALLPRVASALGAALRQHRLQRHHDAFRAAAAPRTAAAHPGAVRLPSAAVRIRVPSGPKTSRERCSELGRQFSAQDARSSRRKWREEEENLLQNGLFGSARPSLGRK